jgi:hypothetical protein
MKIGQLNRLATLKYGYRGIENHYGLLWKTSLCWISLSWVGSVVSTQRHPNGYYYVLTDLRRATGREKKRHSARLEVESHDQLAALVR